jgi:hypothetical protein
VSTRSGHLSPFKEGYKLLGRPSPNAGREGAVSEPPVAAEEHIRNAFPENRENNRDYFKSSSDAGLFLVADLPIETTN